VPTPLQPMPREDQNAATLEVSLGAAPGDERARGGVTLAFGRYRLLPDRRVLLSGEQPVELKSRAFDVLLTLAEARGTLVTREDLSKRVWPKTVVDPHNLDIQISTLRKALGSDRDLIVTDTGRGYRLAVPVRTLSDSPHRTTNLPAPISALIGRERELTELQDIIALHRLVTLTGAGGIGKTQLSLEAVRRAQPSFADGAWLVELGPLADAELLSGVVARALGIEPGSNRNHTDQLVAFLHKKHLLLVLDNCEHVIGPASGLVETLMRGAPGLHIVATSREPLVAEGEHIFRVNPLSFPLKDAPDIAQGLKHSAVQLFVERATAADPRFSPNDGAIAAVSKICRHLDGIPLAIELAAACVASIGVDALAGRLDDRFRLLTEGRRSALPRHQTLRATLDWSYGLLAQPEQAVLRRLAVFAGSFTLDGAGAAAGADGLDPSEAASHVARLVRKSLVTFDIRGGRYRLLDTTRCYAREKLTQANELPATARRHAAYYQKLLDGAEASWQSTPAHELAAKYAPELDDIRLALTWAFSADGAPEIGVALAAAAVPLWTSLSILGECRGLVDRALSHLGRGPREQKRHEMILQAALGRSSIWAKGAVSAACSAATRSLELAEELEDTDYQLRALYILWVYRLWTGEYRTSLQIAERFRQIAEKAGDLLGSLTGWRLEGNAWHHLGDHAQSRLATERVIEHGLPNMHRSFVVRFGLDQRVAALAYLGRILWLQGFPDQALRTARASVNEALELDHANSLCLALCDGACIVSALAGDLTATEDFAVKLTEHAEQHELGMRHAHGLAFRGWVAVRRGDTAGGLRLLAAARREFREPQIGLYQTIFVGALAEALSAAGHVDEGLEVIESAIRECVKNDGCWRKGELLRLKGEFALRYGRPNSGAAAEANFLEALDLARRQQARSWELRAAMSLARLWYSQDRLSAARDVLVPVYDWFTEGFDTADLHAAKVLVDELR
jgi:predicted ATPase/DNA-binding winged helix-turn-helix (wHTH) protein